jgi:XTP/dITP diphosphohydrolase
MPSIVLATANPHKIHELRGILGSHNLQLLGLNELGHPAPPEPAETGTTFEQNASIKALAYAAATGLPCLADDSGLEIDALDGRPGVISSHFSTDGLETGLTRAQRDAANNARVLRELDAVPLDRRSARFVCVMALAHEDKLLALARGTFEGRMGLPGDVPRGGEGFGYDPLFLVAPDYRQTSAELTPAEKNSRSHRAAAARVMIESLRTLIV